MNHNQQIYLSGNIFFTILKEMKVQYFQKFDEEAPDISLIDIIDSQHKENWVENYLNVYYQYGNFLICGS